MERRATDPPALRSLPEHATWVADMPPRERSRIRDSMERLIAQAYGLTYDFVVRSFEPYQALLQEVATFVERSRDSGDRAAVKVLDVACGTGTVALELARLGYSVVGLDVVGSLVGIARDRGAGTRAEKVEFHQLDVASDPIPGAGAYDVLVSMHTLYWHPDPHGLLEGCRRALKPGGHAVFLTYSRPARVRRTFREIRAVRGWGTAVRSLRWLLPTALFERFRDYQPHYMGAEEFHEALRSAGFTLLEARTTFLADISLLAWVRADSGAPRPRG
jgi:SAM-dependent methyltransferase